MNAVEHKNLYTMLIEDIEMERNSYVKVQKRLAMLEGTGICQLLNTHSFKKIENIFDYLASEYDDIDIVKRALGMEPTFYQDINTKTVNLATHYFLFRMCEVFIKKHKTAKISA